VAIPEAQLLDVAPVEPPLPGTITAPGGVLRGVVRGTAYTILGVVLVVVAGWGIRSSSVETRTAVALIGGAFMWRGLQRLGTIRFGPSFRLGFWVAIVWLSIVVFCSVFTSLLPVDHWQKAEMSREALGQAPGLRWPEPLGRDINGHSLLSQVTYGGRTSLMIGFVAVAVGLGIGLVFGLLAGWYGKAIDAAIGIGTNTILAFPPLILILAIVAVYDPSVKTLALGLAVLSIPTYTRLMRAQTLAIRQREFVLAARAMGASNSRLMWREVLPNALIPVVSYSFIVIAVTIVAEGSLSYLGVGVPSPKPSWGGMIADGQRKLKTDPHLVFVPATVMFLTVLSFNRVGEVARARVLGVKTESR
jgi:peptide/nickel transport system permease protein